MPSKVRWHPDEPARDVLYRKIQDRLASQDSCITFLLVEIRALQKRVEKLEKRNADRFTPKDFELDGELAPVGKCTGL